MPIKAVLDTNVLVSGLVTESGASRQVVDAWLEGEFTLVISPYLLEELIHVLTYPRIASRIRLEEEDLGVLLEALTGQAEVTDGALSLPGVTRDPKDDPVVACAKEGNADYIVSGNQDLLVIGEYEGIRIVSPRAFAEILRARKNP